MFQQMLRNIKYPKEKMLELGVVVCCIPKTLFTNVVNRKTSKNEPQQKPTLGSFIMPASQEQDNAIWDRWRLENEIWSTNRLTMWMNAGLALCYTTCMTLYYIVSFHSICRYRKLHFSSVVVISHRLMFQCIWPQSSTICRRYNLLITSWQF